MAKQAKRENKETIVPVRYPASLLLMIDEEVQADGSSRSSILRRIALRHYQRQAKNDLDKVGA